MRALLNKIKDNNILVEIVDGKLKVFASDPALHPALIAEIKEKKNELFQFLSENSQAGDNDAIKRDLPATSLRLHYPLSSAQRRLWLLSQLEEGNVAYNMPGIYVFEGALSVPALELAFKKSIERHESLRTVFREDEQGEPRQFILSPAELDFHVQYHDLRDAEEQEMLLHAMLEKECMAAFDLTTGPLLRAALYQVADDKWVFGYVMHHIISDGWSMRVLFNELIQFYNAQDTLLTSLRIQYKDYAAWQQEQLNGDALNADKTYWLQQFEGTLPVLELPADRNRPAIKTYRGGTIHKTIDAALTREMKSLCQQQGATLFMGLMATVNTLLYRYTGQADIILGSPVAGRTHIDLEGQIGCFLNTLPLRTTFTGDHTYKQLLDITRRVTLSAYDHQAYPFDELITALDLPYNMGRNPLFDVTVVLQNTTTVVSQQQDVPGNLSINTYKGNGYLTSKFDLIFNFIEAGEALQVNMEYNGDLFDQATALRITNHFEQLMRAIIAEPSKPVKLLKYLDKAEEHQLLVTFNDTQTDYPKNKTIKDLFEAQVEQTPGNIALEFESVSLSYTALNEISNQLGDYLQTNYNITTGDLVGIKLERSEWLIITVLAVLKAGGAYVPIDTDYPQARIDDMLADSNCKLLIDEQELDRFRNKADNYTKENLHSERKPNDLAYVMYTSGSTGKPKGVIVEDGNIIRLVKGIDYVLLSGEEALLSTGSFSFDATTFEYWAMLLNGGRLVLCSSEVLLDNGRLAAEIATRNIDMMWFTAGWLNQLVDTDISLFKNLKTVLAGGDRLSPFHIGLLQQQYPSLDIVNGYGPTENTTFSLTCHVDASVPVIPIGKPINNSTAYIIDTEGLLVPVGVIGEICLGGDGLSRGYFNNPMLTAEKFVSNPFRQGERMYKTGDIGRWRPDGTVEFLGRKDDQVKVRGYRVEMGEIETILQQYAPIDAAVVVAKGTANGDKHLIAYLVSKEELNSVAIRSYLATSLPAYMIPDYYVQLEALPLTSNGKVDRKNLPDPVDIDMPATVEYIAPRNETEEKLAMLWQEVLGKNRIGIHDDFFNLGGQSLKASRLAGIIYKTFDVKISLKEIFTTTVLEQQAELIRRARKTNFVSIPVVSLQPHYPLSSSQRRLWILSQFEESNIAYNMPGVYVFEGSLDQPALSLAFDTLVARHESLRTEFREDEKGEIRQFIKAPGETNFRITYYDLRHEREQEILATNLVQQEFGKPFDLSKGPLLRGSLCQLTDDKWIFTYTMHHIISDAWSMRVLISELIQLYDAYTKKEIPSLTPLRIHYKDYAAWQQEQLTGDALQAHKTYWLKQLEDELPVLELMTDKPRPAIRTYHGDVICRTIDNKLNETIKSISRGQGASLFMGLLGVINTLLFKYCNQHDIIIGTTTTGRAHIDLEDQIGFYVNTLALRTRFSGQDSYSDLLATIKQVTVDAYEHQVYPFDELVNELHLQRDMSRHPLFDVLVELQSNSSAGNMLAQAAEGISVSAWEKSGVVMSKFDLRFVFTETGDELKVWIEYNTDLFTRPTIEIMGNHLEQLMSAIAANPHTAISQLDYINKEERNTLVTVFNNTAIEYPREETVVSLFNKQVEKAPGNIALSFKNIKLTYAELNEKANLLAGYLQTDCKVDHGDLVGILLDRSDKMIIAILGILKAGCAYVPIDPAYPRARQEHILKETGMKVLLTQTDYMFDLDYYTGNIFAMDIQLDIISSEGKASPAINQPADTAYVIYTSGSTGQPKGCVITHASLFNYIQWANDYYFNQLEDVSFGLFTALSFDLTVTCIYCSLTQGGELFVYDQQEELSDILRHSFSGDSRINSIKLTPSHINALKHLELKSSSIACAIVGGEEMTTEHVNILKRINPTIKIYNEYGPTEATVGCVVKELEENAPVLIGKPIANSAIYILDEARRLCATGVPGELFIAGAGLASKYFNQPELTAEKFLPDPFKVGERMYRTGDLGRWLPDGNISFIGRKDEQVKIRGYRIELGEIETALQGYRAIDTATVIVRSNETKEKELVAYVVSREPINVSEIRSHLQMVLPVYMIPAHYVQLDKMPLTTNGKVDRRKLPDHPDATLGTGAIYVAGRNKTEEEMLLIWQEVLTKEKLGIKDNFFDAGGDSIRILRMLSEFKKRLGLEIPVADIYKYNTVELIADHFVRHRSEIERKNNEIKQIEVAVKEEIELIKRQVLSSENIVDRDNIEDVYPMSDIEKGMLFESLADTDIGVYHDQKVYAKSFTHFNKDVFKQALDLLTEKHSILRTSFNLDEFGIEVKMVHRRIVVPFQYADISALDRSRQEKWVEQYMRSELQHPFDFSTAPLWRMSVFNLGNDEFVFLLQCHHAILDGWSETSLIAELNNLYLSVKENPLYQPGQLRSDYKDFIIQHWTDKRDDSIKQFWQQELAGCARLDLFREEEHYERHVLNLGSEYLKKIERVAGGLNTTVKAISLSAYLYMLKVFNFDNEVVTGLVTHNRPNTEDGDKILGCFLNTIPLRVVIDGGLKCSDFITMVHDKLIALKDNERLSMLDISLLHQKQQRVGNPFFDVLFNHIDFHVIDSIMHENTEGEKGMKLPDVDINSYVRGNTYFDFSISTTGNTYSISVNLRKKLKCDFAPHKVADVYAAILDCLIESPQTLLGEIDYIGKEEKQQLLVNFNDTQPTFSTDQNIVELITQQALANPGKIAIRFNTESIDYASLERKANQLATYLRSNYFIKADTLFGVMMDRSISMMECILGIWKTGSAYVPIDSNYPDDRIKQIVDASGITALLVEGTIDNAEQIAQHVPVIHIDEIRSLLADIPETLPVKIDPADLAYVIYTSGSTGKPKGVMIEHFGMINHIGAKISEMGIDRESKVAQNAAHTFDISVWQFFSALAAGGTTVIYDQETVADPAHFIQRVAADGITVLELVPSYFVEMLALLEDKLYATGFPALQILVLNAETLMPSMVKRWLALYPNIPIINTYGATEASDDISHYIMHNCPDTSTVPVSRKPIQNFEIYIVNERLQLVPVGVKGEILLAGPAVGRGYLNDKEKTEQSFLTGPLDGITRQSRIYRTGDIGRYLPDGSMEFLGRKDTQVKIRGNRVELGEIEHTLTGIEEIENSAVLANQEHQYLVAYYQSEKELFKEYILNIIKGKLPEYMLPQYFIWVPKFPLTPNGKIDRKALPAPDTSLIATAYTAPRNETEQQLVLIWQEVLGIEKIGVHDNFFDLGGHSLKITRLASKVHKQFNVKIALRDLFITPVLEDQVKLIRSARKIVFNAISPVALQTHYPLSSSQRRMWILSQFEEGNIAYNMPGVFVFEGQLNIAALEYSFLALIQRHESLRTVFREDEHRETKQFISPAETAEFNIACSDLRNEMQKEERVKALVQNDFNTPFDLSTGPLLRAGLYQVADDRWIFTYVMHHIISDGWSMGILLTELLTQYDANCKGECRSLTPLTIQYKDYAVWQQTQLGSELLNEQKNYWVKQFEGSLPVLELVGDKPRPAVKTFNGSKINKVINPELSRRINDLSQEQGATLFMGLLAAVNVLLYRYTSQEDIIIGSPIAGREHADLDNQVGLFVNTLALRTQFEGDNNYLELLKQVKQVTIAAYQHQLYPFDELVNELNLQRDMSRNALFDVMVVLQNAGIGDMKEIQDPYGLKVSSYEEAANLMSKFDLVFNFTETGSGIQLSIEFNTDIYNQKTVERLGVHLEQILLAVTDQPALPISELDYLNEEEKRKLLVEFNNTTVSYPTDKTIIELFEQQVEATTSNIALAFEDGALTYGELNEKANQLGNYLRSNYDIRPDDVVAIQLEQKEWMVPAILGVLKSGAAYLPVDPGYPQERISFMIMDSRCKLLIDEKELDKFKAEENRYEKNNLKVVNKPSDLAYVIYTSGSTGQPKGVMVENRSLINLCFWHNNNFSVTAADRATLYAGVGFDAAVWELFPYIIAGAGLYIIPADIRLNITELAAYYTRNDITISFLPTQIGEQFSAIENHSLRYLLTGGDKLNSFSKKKYRLINNYGPTENTVVATSCEIEYQSPNIPIGKPIFNNQVYILTSRQQLCPVGVPGEICIGGDSLVRGYLDRPELMKEKFVSNPYKPGALMFRTGDTGRWLDDGTIEFTGRKDEQVKIRGYRVEPGEIENVLQQYPGIESSVVVARQNADGQKGLVAYMASLQTLNVQDIRSYLGKQLPAYMIPAQFVQLPSLPLTPNGKVDRRALPAPDDVDLLGSATYVAPRNETEATLVLIWQELLGRERISIKDNFFELGGHSLKITQLASYIYKELGVKTSFKELFSNEILEDQARMIQQHKTSAFIAISPVPDQHDYALSSAQRLFWMVSQFDEGNIAYNIPGVNMLEGDLDIAALEYAFAALIERHESLRTVFQENENGEPRQFICSSNDTRFRIAHHDLRAEEDKEAQVSKLVQQQFGSAFDLASGPLVSAGLFRIDNNKWVFTYVMHHIISDGWSMNILVKELCMIYNAYRKGDANPLTPLRIQYKDYAAWQLEQLNGRSFSKQKTYWLKQFEGELPVLELKYDRPRPPVKTYNGGVIHTTIDAELTGKLRSLLQEQGATLFMGLLATVNALLHRYTNQEDIIIGTSVAGREHIDLEDQIGYYLNTLALRTRFNGKESYRELLKNVKQVTLDAYEHQMYPFEELVASLKLQRDISRNNLFDVLVVMGDINFNDNKQQPLSLDGVTITDYREAEQQVAKFDLSFSFAERVGAIELSMEYNSDLFDKQTVLTIADHFKQILTSLIEEPGKPVQQLNHLSSTEQATLLAEWNNRTENIHKGFSTAIDADF